MGWEVVGILGLFVVGTTGVAAIVFYFAYVRRYHDSTPK